MVLPLQKIVQVTEQFIRGSIRSLIGVLDPVNVTFDNLVRPRLQEHGDSQLVRAKQHQEDLEDIVLLLAPFTRLYLDHRFFAQLETPEAYSDLFKVDE